MPTKLRITDIERITARVPFTPRCQEWNAREIWQWGISEVIRIQSDAGLVGYGETLPHYTWGRVSDEAIERVKGGNPADFLGDDSLGAGLQMALYDLVGKALEVPLYRLLNLPKVRDWCPISWWTIDFPPEALAAEAEEALARGYTAYKTKARPWWDVFAQVEAINAVTPTYFKLDLDWNQMLINAGNAARCWPSWTGMNGWRFTSRRLCSETSRDTARYARRRPAHWRSILTIRPSGPSSVKRCAMVLWSAAGWPACCAKGPPWRRLSRSLSGCNWSALG